MLANAAPYEPITMDGEFTLRLLDKRRESDSVVSLHLAAADGRELPAWSPGAHIDLALAPGLVRQYSLCGDPHDRTGWRFAVLREEAGRGGSAFVHDTLRAGDLLQAQALRNNFPCVPAAHYLFIAGGIGITPILPMLAAVDAARADWRLIYGGRRRSAMAFTAELARYGARVSLQPQDEVGLLDLDTVLADTSEAHAVYCCGPESLISAVEARFRGGCRGTLHVERFKATPVLAEENTEFDVVLARSKRQVHVPAGQSILETLEQAGVDMPFSCREGVCGTCETRVLAGRPDHRDQVLSEAERAGGKVMMVCVSRSLDPVLELDL